MAISLAFYKLFILLKIPSALDSIFIQQALAKLNADHLSGLNNETNHFYLPNLG
jgi:hypothetical protein